MVESPSIPRSVAAAVESALLTSIRLPSRKGEVPNTTESTRPDLQERSTPAIEPDEKYEVKVGYRTYQSKAEKREPAAKSVEMPAANPVTDLTLLDTSMREVARSEHYEICCNPLSGFCVMYLPCSDSVQSV